MAKLESVIPVRTASTERKQASARQRRYRQRCRNGESVVSVKITADVIVALLRRGLSESDSRDRQKLADELSEVLGQWAAEWLK